MIREINAELFTKMIISAAANLSNHRQEVDNMNVFPVPDGDTGTNMSMTIDACAKAIAENGTNDIAKDSKTIADAALRGARGNSGVILSQLLRGMQKSLVGKKAIGVKQICEIANNASKSAYKAVMKPTEGTILTVAREMAECAGKYADDFEDLVDYVALIVDAGNTALQKTPELLPQLKQAGVVDSGGQGLMYIVEGALHVIKNNEEIQRKEVLETKKASTVATVDIENLKYQYCTECIIEKKNSETDAFSLKMKLETIGDSMVVVDDEEVIKVHVHTNTPDFVLCEALKLGELFSVKIENMKLQHNNIVDMSNKDNSAKPQNVELKEYGFVCVSVGDGLDRTFTELGVDVVIKGGQTMNPSTDDILKAINDVGAKNVYVFPNNKNIIMAAEQAKELSDKNVFVIQSRSITQAMAAMLCFDQDASVDENFDQMCDAVHNVKSAQITYAVRDTVVNDKTITPGDMLGIVEGKIEDVSKDICECMINTLNLMVDDDCSAITLFYGEDVSKDDAEKLKEIIEDKFDECDVFLHFGGQPVYYYLISVE